MAAPVAVRAAGYGMPGTTLDGTDVDAVHAATTSAIERARGGGGPSLLELRVPRLVPHSSQDDESYRSDAERADAAARDPLLRLRARLLADAVLDQSSIDAEQRSIDELVQADLQRALAVPEPEAGRAHRWMYAGDRPMSAELAESQAAWPGTTP